MFSKTLFLAVAAAAVATAQSSVTSTTAVASSTISQSMPPAATQGFNIGNTTSSDRFNWCHAQTNSCPEICGGAASTNYCNQDTLQYQCICRNGTAPDCSAYTGTVPYWLCVTTYDQCIANHPNDAQGQQVCHNNEQCGTQNSSAVVAAISSQSAASASSTAAASSSASASATSGGSSGSSSSSSAPAASSKSAATTQTLANGAFFAMLLAAFKLLI